MDTDWSRRRTARFVRWWYVNVLLRLLRSTFAPTTVIGAERLDGVNGPVVIVANHSSHADTMLVLLPLPRRLRRRVIVAAAADYFFTSRFTSTLSSLLIGAIPVDRTKVSRKTLEDCHRLLTDGWSLMLYPEGGRSTDGEIAEFKAGAAWIARRAKVPVLPIHISGSRDVLPKGRKWPRRHPVTISIGTPISVADGEDARGFNRRIEAAVRALAPNSAAEE